MRYPTGHARSPVSDAELERKFHGMVDARRGVGAANAALDRLRRLEEIRDMGAEVVAPLAEKESEAVSARS
jgi:hypothetical protein